MANGLSRTHPLARGGSLAPAAELPPASPAWRPALSGFASATTWKTALVLLLLFAATWLIQYLGPTWNSDINVYPDSPAHYLSGLLIHDYIRQGFPAPPLKFAEAYYGHYPKVAIGHWPPAFYMLQACWMLIFGDSIHADLVLMALLTALLAATVYVVARREFRSETAAFGAALLLLGIPVVELYGTTIMADLPVALFSFWAALCWASYLASGRIRSVVAFSCLAALTVLTKGNGFALLLLPPLTVLLARRFALLRNWRLWLAAAPLALCLPWSIATRKLIAPTMQYEFGGAFFARALWFYSTRLISEPGIFVSLFALVGIGWTIRDLVRRKISGLWLSLLGLLLAILMFHSLTPAGIEPRYLIAAMPCLVLFALRGAAAIAAWLPFPSLSFARRAQLLGAAIGIVFALTVFALPAATTGGFAETAAFVTSRPELARSVILVSTENDGEGPFIARLAEIDRPRPNRVVLRASHTLAESDWNGRGYRCLMHSPAEMESYLESVPVGVIVIDRTSHIDPNLHQPLLEKTIAAYPHRWMQMGVFPANPAQRQDGGIAVYRMIGADTTPRRPIVLGAAGTLRRQIVVDPARRPW